MALTETQKTRVRMYLGYERGFDINSRLASKLISLSAEEETEVGGVLTQLTAIDTKMASVATSATPQVKRVDEIEFRDDDPLVFLVDQGRRLVRRLEALLRVPAALDYYGTADGGAGGVIPLG